MLVTHSELETFRRCPRLHLFKYVLLRRPRVVAESLELGTLIHAGLEAWFGALRNKSEVDPLEWALAAIANTADRRRVDKMLRVQSEELLLGYHCRWSAETMEVLEVERQFEVDVVDPVLGEPTGVRLGGKIDAIVRIGDEDYLVEHKSSSFDLSPGSHYWERARLSAQLGLYWLGARSLGYNPRGCVYDVLGKPRDHEPLRATLPDKRKYRRDGLLYKGMSKRDEEPESYRERLRAAIQSEPELFFARQVVVRLKDEIDEAVRDIAATCELMRVTNEIGAHPRNVDACWNYNRRCDFFGCCAGEADVRDEHLFRTALQKHEELGG